jgi:XRE family transcriptional regulator of biofilm formation
MELWTVQPLPRTSSEPVCGALAAVIRQRRQARGLSLNRLAATARLSRQMLSFIETNRRVPTIDTVARISRALGLPCSKLVAEAARAL